MESAEKRGWKFIARVEALADAVLRLILAEIAEHFAYRRHLSSES